MTHDGTLAPLEGTTLGNGKFQFNELLGGARSQGIWSGWQVLPTRRDVLIGFRYSTPFKDEFLELVGCVVPGVAPLLYAGPLDTLPGMHALVVARPPGDVVSAAPRLQPREVVALGLSLCDTIIEWSSRGRITAGLRPETVFVDGKSGNRRFAGTIPQMLVLLGNSNMYAPFPVACYDPPSADIFVDIALDDEVFVVGLLLWYALLKEHPYQVPGHTHDYNNIWEDRRKPFSGGPPELGRLLEAVLVADPERRMKAVELRDELERLARTWGVELPPFPPPGLAAS